MAQLVRRCGQTPGRAAGAGAALGSRPAMLLSSPARGHVAQSGQSFRSRSCDRQGSLPPRVPGSSVGPSGQARRDPRVPVTHSATVP